MSAPIARRCYCSKFDQLKDVTDVIVVKQYLDYKKSLYKFWIFKDIITFTLENNID